MRRLYPQPHDDVNALVAYGRLATHGHRRPAVRRNMISSADGAAVLAGRSGTLGRTADQDLLAVLRSLADVILVGAGTMRAEGYGPARLDQQTRARRRDDGMRPVPPIAVVTRHCQLAWNAPFFTDAEARPIVITPSAAAVSDRARAATVADVITAGETSVDLPSALEVLAERGHSNVLAEGGPALTADLAAANAIDELCLTVSPLLTAGAAHRILDGPQLSPPQPLSLQDVFEADGYLFLRYQLA